jgi:nucleoid-associated protein YgaU
MNKYGYILLGILLVFNTGITLQAAETEAQPGYTDSFLHNEFLLESARLIALAEESFAANRYDEAIRYAAEAERYSQLSDEYVSLQMKIKEANDTIATAEARMDRAKVTGAAKRYAETFEEAELVFTEAVDARTGEDWDKARDSALHVLALLETFPDEPVFPAQYVVKSWVTAKDCLWNIAAKPEIYGDPFQWRHIYNANRAQMPKLDDPNLIKPGMVLEIPSIRGEIRYGRMEEE